MAQKSKVTDGLNKGKLAAILEKRRRGEKLTQSEIRAVDRYQKNKTREDAESFSREMTQQSIAEIFEVKRARLVQWESEGMPRNKNGTYNWPACFQWILSRPDADLTQRKHRADLEMKELQVARARRELIPSKDFRRAIDTIIERLTEAQNRLGREHGDSAQAILNESLDAIAQEVADNG